MPVLPNCLQLSASSSSSPFLQLFTTLCLYLLLSLPPTVYHSPPLLNVCYCLPLPPLLCFSSHLPLPPLCFTNQSFLSSYSPLYSFNYFYSNCFHLPSYLSVDLHKSLHFCILNSFFCILCFYLFAFKSFPNLHKRGLLKK